MSLRLGSFGLALALLAADFITKRHVLANAAEFASGIRVIDGLVHFTYVRNSGAAFGIFQGARWPFVATSLVAVVVLTVVLVRGHSALLRRSAYSLILAGAAGNLIDRVFYDGLVVDFIQLEWPVRNFPVFNVADMGVSIGAVLLVLGMLLEDRRGDPEISAADDSNPGVTPPVGSDGFPTPKG